MEQKKIWKWTLGMLIAAFVLGLLKNALNQVYLFAELYVVAYPLLLIAAGICGYFIFKDKITIPGKGIWAVMGILLYLAFQNLELVSFGILVSKQKALPILAALLYAAGSISLILSFLDEKFRKLLYIGFAVLALSALCGGVNAAHMAQCLLYAALAVIIWNVRPGYNPIFRTVAVILAVCTISSIGWIPAVCWILFAFVLVPADRSRTFHFSFAKITAMLCALTAVIGLIAFADGEPLRVIENRNKQISTVKEEIADNEEKIPQLQEAIVKCQEDIAATEETLANEKAALTEANDALTKAKNELSKAEANLDKECRRSSYSYWYCDKYCRPLHTAVDTKNKAVSTAQKQYNSVENNIEDLEYDISSLQKRIKNNEKEIKNTEQRIEELKKELSRHYSHLVAEYFQVLVNTITALLSAAALFLLMFCFYKGEYGKLAFMACGAMALSAFLPMLPLVNTWKAMAQYPVYMYPVYMVTYKIISILPSLARMAIAALLTILFAKKDVKLAKYRVSVILIAAPMLLAAAAIILGEEATSSLLYMLFYSVTMICAALVLVPPVFTEYNSIAKHLFFTFISAGIWQLIWIYHVTRNLNSVSSVDSRKPSRELLLSMFLPFYYSYWILKTAENVEAYAAEHDKQCKLDVICFVFAFICPLISTVLIQNKINQIVGTPE